MKVRVRGLISPLLVISFPVLLTLFVVRLAFTETFLEFLYPRVTLPPDPMPYELRLSIAKLGLSSVLSDRGMEEFIRSGLFNYREIKHMEDVKNLLEVLFTFLYFGLPLWFAGILSLRRSKDVGKVIFFGSLLLELFVLFVIVSSITSYEWLFVAFHNVFFDPYSWRFSDEDMLLRVYPMDLWFKATIFTAGGVFLLNIFLQLIGFILWRKGS